MGEAEVIPLRGAGGRPRPRPAPRRRGAAGRPAGGAADGVGDGGTADEYRVDGGGATQDADAPGTDLVPARPSELESAVTEVAAFLRRRLAGRYPVDEFGFDRDLTENVIAARPSGRSTTGGSASR